MYNIKVTDRAIGQGESCFIIAEAGVNHNGSIERAKQLIDVAANAGADAVKFQTFVAGDLVSVNAPKAKYQIENTGRAGSQLDMIKKLELSPSAHRELVDYAMEKGIIFLSTPFDEGSVDLLEQLKVPLFKIGSGEVTNHPFLRYIAKKKLPVILSTGMSTLEEVKEAVDLFKEDECKLVLLHCTSNYPALTEDCNLLAMDTMRKEFDLPVGYSDHTPGINIPVAAVAMGACVIEKHITMDKNLEGPDHKASLDPAGLKEMVRAIRMVEEAKGCGNKKPVEAEIEMRSVARRSIVAKVDILKDTVIKENMITFKRPGTGISPKDAGLVIGRTAVKDIHADEIIEPGSLK